MAPPSYPLASSEFFGLLQMADFTMNTNVTRTFSRTGAGEIIPSIQGATLWKGAFTVIQQESRAATVTQGLMEMLMEEGYFFLLYDPRVPYPEADPGAVVLGASTVTVGTVDASNRQLTLAGLPVGYVITPGDAIGYTYGSSPVRYQVHKALSGGVADGTGETGLITVNPRVQPGVVGGESVSLVRPEIKATFVSAPQYGGSGFRYAADSSVQFIQTMR